MGGRKLHALQLRKDEWGLNVALPQSAEQYYYNGISASMNEYGVTSGVSEYIERNGIKWNTNGLGCRDYRAFYKADINGKGGYKNNLEQVWNVTSPTTSTDSPDGHWNAEHV